MDDIRQTRDYWIERRRIEAELAVKAVKGLALTAKSYLPKVEQARAIIDALERSTDLVLSASLRIEEFDQEAK